MKKASINLIIIGFISLLISVLSLTTLNEISTETQMITYGVIGFISIMLISIGVILGIGSVSPEIYRFTHRIMISDNTNEYTYIGNKLSRRDITQLKEISGKTVHEIFRTCPVIVESDHNQRMLGIWFNYKQGYVYATNKQEAIQILKNHGFGTNTPVKSNS